MTREAIKRTVRINKVRRYDAIVGINDGKKNRNDDKFKKAYAEFKREPYGMKGE